jgi:hypothetical protein
MGLRRPILTVAGILAAALLALAAGLAVWAGLDNRSLPTRSDPLDRLSAGARARLAEARHLRRTLGDAVWPGWAASAAPVVVYNERYAFLGGYDEPPSGWIRVPAGTAHGGPWEIVPDERIDGAPYYRQALPDGGARPEAFTVRIGERWVASLPTLEWFRIDFARHLREQVPGFLRPVLPSRFVTDLFLGGSDGYICLLSHESFHAFQGEVAPESLAAAERPPAAALSDPEADPGWQRSWQEELRLLATGARAADPAETRRLARRFLDHRRARRARFRLDPGLVAHERRREWLEGIAKYVELEVWRQAARTRTYRPVPATAGLSDFRAYSGFAARWSREIDQIARSGGDDVRFYYSGMAQAAMLDRLLPGWKPRVLPGGECLEDLLAEATSGAP